MTRRNPPRIRRPQRIIATMEKDAPRLGVPFSIRTPEMAVRAFEEYIGKRAHEIFVVLFLNNANTPIGYTEVTQASLATVGVDIGGILREALVAGAKLIITAHQHPSGLADPSTEDETLWMRLRTACDFVGITVLDNFVLGEHEYYSDRDERKISYPERS